MPIYIPSKPHTSADSRESEQTAVITIPVIPRCVVYKGTLLILFAVHSTVLLSATMSVIDEEVRRIKADIEEVRVKKRKRLQDLDFFVLDNSIRESTVGQLRSHTLENKLQIYEAVKKCGYEHIIVASFAHMKRVDDEFVQNLKDRGDDFSNLYSFSEVTEGVKNGRYDTEKVPVSLKKNKRFGLRNVFFEADLASEDVKWGETWTVEDMCQLILKWMEWVYDKISKDARILINLRDLPIAMTEAPERVLSVVKFLASLPPDRRMFALAFEDPMGEYLPEELEAWTASVRRVMDANGWKSGKLLVHIHQKWDLQTASQLDCLSSGADGVWASLCEEGAAMGHACSSVTLLNLIRLGNTKVLKKYNCTELRNAAKTITKITTGKQPHPKQCVYGQRAVDLVFGGIGVGDFDLAGFFGVETPNRITTLASPTMIKDRLINLFGDNPHFTEEIGAKMKKKMLEDLHSGRKEEYMSKVGIAILFDRSGGELTEEMSDVIAKVKVANPHHERLIAEIRDEWDSWDVREEERGDERLQFDSFYHGFMAPYFGCYRCKSTKKGLLALDMNSDGYIDWKEFLVYIKWALHEYPQVESADDLLSIVFEKGLIPAMRDERLKSGDKSSLRF